MEILLRHSSITIWAKQQFIRSFYNSDCMVLLMKSKLKYHRVFFFLLITHMTGFSQPTISGPTCAVPGIVYHYTIKGSWKASSTMQVCISNGIFRSKDTSMYRCTPQGGAPLSSLLVVWSNPGSGSLTLSSALGNSTLNVTVAPLLQAGTIDSSSKKQAIGYDSVPLTIVCSPDSGGSCSPVYMDQWQQSFDMLSWKDIQGATSGNLAIVSPLTQATFYRRKVTEKTSGTIAYSDIAFVDVGPPPPSAFHSHHYPIGIEKSEIAFYKRESKIKTF
jgi:hypothetical protein